VVCRAGRQRWRCDSYDRDRLILYEDSLTDHVWILIQFISPTRPADDCNRCAFRVIFATDQASDDRLHAEHAE
jgi:transposase-like protein